MTGPPNHIGIIAGSGSLTFDVAQSVVDDGGAVHVIMVEGSADPSLTVFPHTVVNWAQPGRATTALKRAGVRDIVMLGGFQRPNFKTARPDFAFFQVLPAVLRFLKSGGDDAVLRGLVALFERRGFRVVGVADVARRLLIGEGALTKRNLSEQDAADIDKGFALIAALGRYDIGQAAVVAGGRIEAIEGAEGTDRMLGRVAEVRRDAGNSARGGVLVKRPKPSQDLRVDLPAIGPSTVENADAAGLAGIAVMAGHVLAAERPQMISVADERALYVVGVKSGPEASRVSVREGGNRISGLGAVPIRPRDAADMLRAAGILSTLSAFRIGSAVVVDAGRAIAVGTHEKPGDVICRAAGLRGRNTRRKGLVAVDASSLVDEALLHAADACNLNGVLAMRTLSGAKIHDDVIRLADKLGMFIAIADHSSHG